MHAEEQYIRENRERLFKLWMVQSCLYGSFLFLMLSGPIAASVGRTAFK